MISYLYLNQIEVPQPQFSKDTYVLQNPSELHRCFYFKKFEKVINDKAMERNIVVHGSAYVGEKLVARSLGCPAVPKNLATPVIDKIKNGSLLYIHTDNLEYQSKTKFIFN